MGRVRTKTVKRASRVLIEKYYPRLTPLDFHLNKKVIDEVAIVPTKRLRNRIAGFTTHLMRRIQRGPVRGISFKLQEEERERKDQYVPEVSALDSSVAPLEIDPDTDELIRMLGFDNLPVTVTAPITAVAPERKGRHVPGAALMDAKYAYWRERYMRSSPAGLYCFYNDESDNEDAITCSEAHGYAMLIAVLHNTQQDFDGLLAFFLAYRNEHGLMKWQIRSNKHGQLYVKEDAEDCATDGDIDIATALFLAQQKWAHGSPMYPAGAYGNEGARLADAIMAHCIHPRLHTPLLGDWCNEEDKQNRKLYDATRSSDFILSSFLLFHTKHPDPRARAQWQQVLESTLEAATSQLRHCKTGLVADFLVHDKNGWVPATWRLAHYYAITRDERILPLLQAMYHTLTSKHFPSVPAGLRVRDAKPLVDYSSRAFIAPVGYLAYTLGDSSAHMAAVRALDDEESSYFGDSIDLVVAEEAMAAPHWLA
ncbi:hypothetical protein MVES_003659 [Malassezia vespertilionis]|uniref:Uncharacterized protein n=1 Tax=Malassezia vespertilionis TaxID=2020962 RepID=A0A2N1J769_9BASI|nr:hypothetical protein MVES_003659 [Malassezia vespertilionis]